MARAITELRDRKPGPCGHTAEYEFLLVFLDITRRPAQIELILELSSLALSNVPLSFGSVSSAASGQVAVYFPGPPRLGVPGGLHSGSGGLGGAGTALIAVTNCARCSSSGVTAHWRSAAQSPALAVQALAMTSRSG